MDGRLSGKNFLIISPSISNIYQDIISIIESWGGSVDYIKDSGDFNDPDFIRYKKHMRRRISRAKEYHNNNEKKWKMILQNAPFDKKYDYLFVIDGMSVSPYLFDELRRRNSYIWCSNYLFDSTISLYRFQNYFKYYNLVASFDRRDCERYNLLFLPIYWVKEEIPETCVYKLFGVGGYGKQRFHFYKVLYDCSKEHGWNSIIQLYYPLKGNEFFFIVKTLIKEFFNDKNAITLKEYWSRLITNKGIPAVDYRKMLCQSEVIVDTVNHDQDGMTARFMWALGLGKKIITTNKHYLSYECYNPRQVLVVDESLFDIDEVVRFVQAPFVISDSEKEYLIKWRIDNWLRILLGNIEN